MYHFGSTAVLVLIHSYTYSYKSIKYKLKNKQTLWHSKCFHTHTSFSFTFLIKYPNICNVRISAVTTTDIVKDATPATRGKPSHAQAIQDFMPSTTLKPFSKLLAGLLSKMPPCPSVHQFSSPSKPALLSRYRS